MSLLTTPTFIIGLGGLGNIVARLIWQRYLTSGRDVPETVRIRSIDTAEQSSHELAPRLPDEMFTKLGEFQANQVIQRLDLYPRVARWWKYPPNAFAPGYIENGAGAKRPVGRLVFFEQFGKVYEAFRSDLTGPKQAHVQQALIEQELGQVRNTPRVFIVGSVAGGTCSGTFIDTAFLVRHLLAQQGYEAGGATITAVLGMPSVIHLKSGDEGSSQARQRQVNALAALSELDGLMQGWQPGEVRLDYPPPVGAFEPQPALFNQVYLFTDRKVHGVTFDRQEDVLQRVAHFVFGQVALGMGQKTLDVLDNFKRYFDPAERAVVDGLPAIYGAFGVEWLEVPHDRLVAKWCAEIAEPIAARVNDFEWGEERRRSLDVAARGVLAVATGGLASYEGLKTVIELVEAATAIALNMKGMPDLQPFFERIQQAKDRRDIEDAVRTFDLQLPTTLDTVRRLARTLPPEDQDEAWVRQVAADLQMNPSFRAGGAQRVLEALARLLSKVNEVGQLVETVDEILKRCGGGLFRRVASSPAVDWAQRRAHEQARVAVRTAFGGRATRLVALLQKQAATMESLRAATKAEAKHLGELNVSSWAPPADSWMLGEADIDAAVSAHRDQVIDAVVQSVSESLAKALVDPTPREGTVLREYLGRIFAEETRKAIERESMHLTRRPDDAAQRIVNRLETCEPMAQLQESGVDYLEVMADDRRATPLKFVLTDMQGEERQRLERWARDQRREGGEQVAFEVAESGDPLRDDALHLTFGWPLWLFSEIRQAVRTVEQLSPDHSVLRSARIMGEVERCGEHFVRPLRGEQSELLFAYAVVTGAIRPVRVDRVVFDSGRFPGQADANGLADALERFRRSGLNRAFKAHLDREQADPAVFRQKINERLLLIDSQLKDVPQALQGTLGRYRELVGKDVSNIVVL
jgi:hypothetical protein